VSGTGRHCGRPQQKCPGSVCGRSADGPGRPPRSPCRPDTDHAHLTWTRRGLRQHRPGHRMRPTSHQLHVRGGYRKVHPVSTLVAGVHKATGHLSRRQTAVDTSLRTDTRPATCAAHRLSGRQSSGSSGRSIRRSLLVTGSSTLPQGRPRPATTRPPPVSPSVVRKGLRWFKDMPWRAMVRG
jgi:hypothetical protein